MTKVHQEKTTDFNNHFYGRVKDLHLFDCGDINILKVVIDGLRNDRELMNADIRFFYRSEWLYRFVLFLMRMKCKIFNRTLIQLSQLQFEHLKKIARRKILLIDDHRVSDDLNGQKVSFYFSNIIKYFGRENVIYIYGGILPASQSFDFNYIHYLHLVLSNRLTEADRTFRRELIKTYQRIKKSKLFSKEELERIRISIMLFYSSYRTWDSILRVMQPDKALLIRTYYTEGLLLALKKHHIKSIELQHGLFSKDDIDYIFPERIKGIKERAFFPDKMVTYGRYWKNLLRKGAEFSDKQIDIIGYYPFVNDNSKEYLQRTLKPFLKGKKVILVATQFFLEREYCEYVHWLSGDIAKKDQPFIILVKLHPGDDPRHYESLKKLRNAKIVSGNINDYLSISDAVVSIFSTVLYDAIRYNVPSFTLYMDTFRSYIDEMIKSGGVQKIVFKESPIDYLDNHVSRIDATYFYDAPDYEVLDRKKETSLA